MEQMIRDYIVGQTPAAIGALVWLIVCGLLGFVLAFIICAMPRGHGKEPTPRGFLKWLGVFTISLWVIGFFGWNMLQLVLVWHEAASLRDAG